MVSHSFECYKFLTIIVRLAPKSSLEDVKKVIQTDLKKSADELFSEFEDLPRGCASLAQVHKARLRETGQIVAVKVQHPRVRDHSLVDMTTMDLLVRLVDQIFPDFSFMWLAEEMKKNLPLELDFFQEAKNADRVSKLFCTKLPWLEIPKVHWDNTTHRVLTMEFVEGGEVTDIKYVSEHKLDPRVISQRLATLYSEMIFVEGYVHCDPHPGNILVRPSKDGPKIILLDHGLYTTLPEKFRLNYSQMWLAIINADLENIKKYGIELGAGDLFPLLAGILVAKPWEAIAAGLTKPKKKDNNKEVSYFNFSKFIHSLHFQKEQLRKYAAEYFPQIAQVLSKINREMLLVLKTNDLLRGIETVLGTRGEKVSLLNMSRYCVNNAYNERIKNGNIVSNVVTRLSKQIVLFKLSMYQCYLWLYYRFYGSDYL